MDTIFSKIIAGEVPCHKVYEDELVFAFLDINPLSKGHVLLIPKEAKKTVGDLSDESAAALGRVMPRLCRAVVQVSGCEDYNILQNNGAPAHQAVFHVHFHIIPKPSADTGLGLGWPAGKLDRELGTKLATEIREALEAI
jgi:histidine triad (HIT) family protein